MTISKDLLLAILAMDSYNRGYEPGIEGLGGENSRIGSTTVKKDAQQLLAEGVAKAAGFYAIAYDTEDYGTVISYRGTNNATDYFRGWTVAAGITDTFTQADETLAFYTAVTGKNYWDGAAQDTIVTGHSLGGGLAGFVSALTGTEGYGFDHMPFGIAAALYGFAELR
jgi:subtilisin family serine protease